MIKIKLIIEAGESNGVLNLLITDNKKTIELKPKIKSGLNEIDFKLETPNVLIFEVSGKTPRDTVIDKASNKILRDKYLKVLGFHIDDKPLDTHKVQQMFVLDSEKNGKIQSSYWGFNGTVAFELTHKDSLALHLANKL